jgi:predicted GNAT family N-acyltransferase
MNETAFSVRQADWTDEADADALRYVRESVFVHEQQVPLELEWDGQDATALHLLAFAADGHAIGSARLLPNGHIGRMAVLREWRRRGVGARLLRAVLELAAQRGIQRTFLNAQTSAVAFYQRFGFISEGEVFIDAGIPHQRMDAPVASASGRRLGQDSGLLRLTNALENRRICADMAAQTRRELCLLSHNLEKDIFDQTAFLRSVKELAVRSRFSRIRILLQDHRKAVKQGRRLIELARRLSSSIEIHIPAEDWLELPENFLLADRHGYVHRELSSEFAASADYHAPLVVERLLARFETIWETSQPDTELRRLYL